MDQLKVILRERYGIRCERALGEGAFATVFAATSDAIDRPFAVKVIPFNYGVDASDPTTTELERFKEKFTLEVKAMAGVTSPFIVGLLAHFMIDDMAGVITMELGKGNDLRECIDQGDGMSRMAVIQCAAQIATALDHLHVNGFIHRDIKPDNVIMFPDRTWRIADMGTAVKVDQGPTLIKCTPEYINAERYEMCMGDEMEDNVSPDVDVFAFACVLFEMMGGVKEFNIWNRSRSTRTPAIPSTMTASMGDDLVELLKECWSSHPPSSSSIAKRLINFLPIAQRRMFHRRAFNRKRRHSGT